MGYYLRVLSPSAEAAPLRAIKDALKDLPVPVKMSFAGPEKAWKQVELAHSDGAPICLIDRHVVGKDGLGAEELAEFLEEVPACKPASGAAWLTSYLPTVKTIYALEILFGGAERDGGWDAIRATQAAMAEAVGGILQADGEGFSNEEGYHVLWQFQDDVEGEWSVAVRQGDGWACFAMDLGSRTHRKHFLRGEVPPGVALAK